MENQELTKNQIRYRRHKERYSAYAKRPDRKERASELVKRPEIRAKRAAYYREQRKDDTKRIQTNEYKRKWQASLSDEKRAEIKRKAVLKQRQPERWLNVYRRGAERRNLPFTLTDKEFHEMVMLPCHYCYAEPDPNNGLDRVDNNVGYTTENCVPCCWMCNHAKGSTPIEEFLPWLARIAAAHGN